MSDDNSWIILKNRNVSWTFLQSVFVLLLPHKSNKYRNVLFFFRPLWLSPDQVMVIPVGPTCEEYAEKVSTHLCYVNTVSHFKGSELLWGYQVFKYTSKLKLFVFCLIPGVHLVFGWDSVPYQNHRTVWESHCSLQRLLQSQQLFSSNFKVLRFIRLYKNASHFCSLEHFRKDWWIQKQWIQKIIKEGR